MDLFARKRVAPEEKTLAQNARATLEDFTRKFRRDRDSADATGRTGRTFGRTVRDSARWICKKKRSSRCLHIT